MTAPLPSPRSDDRRLWVTTVCCRDLLQRMTYVDYGRAEADCEALAQRLISALGRAELRRCAFAPIPRGGLIVLGMLSYLLDLRPEQILADVATAAGPVCLVDDCLLTGLRLKQALARTVSRQVIVAHLYSHPSLRQAVLEIEPQVRACVAARDLALLAPDDGGPAGESAASPGGTALGLQAYWSGAVAPVAFAWTEPVLNMRDPFSGAVETTWHCVAPHRSLRHRATLDVPLQPAAVRTWQAPDDVVWSWHDGVLWLLQTRTEGAYRLEGDRAAIWRELAVHGDEQIVRERLRGGATAEGDGPDAAVDAFVAYLHAEGLLEPAG